MMHLSDRLILFVINFGSKFNQLKFDRNICISLRFISKEKKQNVHDSSRTHATSITYNHKIQIKTEHLLFWQTAVKKKRRSRCPQTLSEMIRKQCFAKERKCFVQKLKENGGLEWVCAFKILLVKYFFSSKKCIQ